MSDPESIRAVGDELRHYERQPDGTERLTAVGNAAYRLLQAAFVELENASLRKRLAEAERALDHYSGGAAEYFYRWKTHCQHRWGFGPEQPCPNCGFTGDPDLAPDESPRDGRRDSGPRGRLKARPAKVLPARRPLAGGRP